MSFKFELRQDAAVISELTVFFFDLFLMVQGSSLHFEHLVAMSAIPDSLFLQPDFLDSLFCFVCNFSVTFL